MALFFNEVMRKKGRFRTVYPYGEPPCAGGFLFVGTAGCGHPALRRVGGHCEERSDVAIRSLVAGGDPCRRHGGRLIAAPTACFGECGAVVGASPFNFPLSTYVVLPSSPGVWPVYFLYSRAKYAGSRMPTASAARVTVLPPCSSFWACRTRRRLRYSTGDIP